MLTDGRQDGTHDRSYKGWVCDDDDGALLQHQATCVSAKD